MALKFKCPKCGQELTVKDELAGRQGKCPACKATVTVPSLAGSKPRPAPAPAPVGRKPAPRDDDVVDAEVVEEVEEVVDAEVVEDDRPARRGGVKRDTSADDFDTGGNDRPSKSRRRDDEDEEDRPRRRGRDDEDDRPRKRGRDDDEDDRPRRRGRDDDEDEDRPRKRAAARGRRDEDYDDDEDYGDDDRERSRKKLRKIAWRKAATGGLLNFIGAILIASVAGLAFLSAILTLIIGAAGGGGAGILGVLGYLSLGLLVASHVLGIVGCVFCLFAPGKNGEMGLAITALVLNGLCSLFFLYLLIDGAAMGLLARGGGRGSMLIILFWPLLELARLTLYAVFMWAACKSAKDYDTSKSALTVGIVVPSSIFGMALIVILLGSMVSSQEMAVVVMILTILMLGAAAGILGWYAMVCGAVKNTMRWAK